MGQARRQDLLREAVRRIAATCPRITAGCYWAGTSAIALEETRHRESFDLDLHTRTALADTRPLMAELKRAFPSLEIVQAPDAFGSGFTGVIELATDHKLTVQVFAAFDDVPDADLVPSATAPSLRRVTLQKYLADKIQCVVERIEARDLVDIRAVSKARPELRRSLRRSVAAQDALLMAERLLAWTDAGIQDDLRGYPDVDPADAIAMRDELLALLKAEPEDD